MAENLRRFYLVCKKSFWGKLRPIKGFFSYSQAVAYCDANPGRLVILRQMDGGDFELDWKGRPE